VRFVLPALLVLAAAAGCGGSGTAAGDPAPQPDPEAGRVSFVSTGCGTCHTLAAAGATGTLGSNLDETRPTYEVAVEAITNGADGMPVYGSQLDDGEIADIAAFVAEAAGP
jgi:mono/diheme cytochrome c family protein